MAKRSSVTIFLTLVFLHERICVPTDYRIVVISFSRDTIPLKGHSEDDQDL